MADFDSRLIELFRGEIEYLRKAGADFGTRYPKIAGRLELSGQESSDPQIDSKDVFQRDARVATILNRGLKSSRPHSSKDKKGNINKRQAAKLKNNKLNWYSKQE